METCVIIQGPTVCDNVSMNKQSWKGYPIIFSTWVGSDSNCYSPTDTIILNEYPEEKGIKNLNLQIISTLSGLYKAKELGFKRAIKWREDFYPTNPSELLKLFKPECINFYAYMNHENGYVTDFFMEGDIDDMIDLFTINDIKVRYPEFAFTKRMYKLGLDSKINFIVKNITEENNIVWKKLGYSLTKHTNEPMFMDSLPEVKHKDYE
jgi:hypothetical protein